MYHSENVIFGHFNKDLRVKMDEKEAGEVEGSRSEGGTGSGCLEQTCQSNHQVARVAWQLTY